MFFFLDVDLYQYQEWLVRQAEVKGQATIAPAVTQPGIIIPAFTQLPEESFIPALTRLPEENIAPALTHVPEENIVPALTIPIPVSTVVPEEPIEPALPANGGGAVYTVWGKSSCPNTLGTELVYGGLAAKSASKESGGGSDYQCLSDEPQYLNYEDGIQGDREYIMGVEYLNWQGGPLSQVNRQGVPCAVCYTAARKASLMIPGRDECPESWTREYYGYLTTERFNHRSSAGYACVDDSPEGIHVSDNVHREFKGAAMVPVETYCESHICPTYDYSRELTCVVCSK